MAGSSSLTFQRKLNSMKEKFIGRKIHGERLFLRLIEELDAEPLHRWLMDKEVRTMTESSEIPYAETIELVKEWIHDPNVVEFIIVDKANDKPIGEMTLRIDANDRLSADFGIVIGESEYRSKGFAREAVETLVSELKREQCLKEITCEILLVNEPSLNLFKNKFGWPEIDRDEQQVYFCLPLNEAAHFPL
jgi:RimJ/RimL family protein N-acetyltransferase